MISLKQFFHFTGKESSFQETAENSACIYDIKADRESKNIAASRDGPCGMIHVPVTDKTLEIVCLFFGSDGLFSTVIMNRHPLIFLP